MTRATPATWRLIGTLICALGPHAAVAGGPKGAAPAAPHVSAPAVHAAIPAPRPAMGGGMGAARAPMMGAAHAPMAAAHPAAEGGARFAAPAQRAGGTTAYAGHAGHFAAPAGGHFGASASHPGALAHAGMSGVHAEGRAGPFGEGAHREADHAAGREEIARDDPARAHGRFDEHVHNPERERDIERLHGHDFHVRDARYFNAHEWGRWRGGYWHRDYYDGRFGWWYDVGGVYYPYDAPVWPFPLVVAPLIAAEASADAPPAPPPAMPIPPLPALPHVAYHCASPAGFYPEVDSCGAGWITIAAH